MNLPPPPPRPQLVTRQPRRGFHPGIWIGASVLVFALMAAGGWLWAELPDVSDQLDRFHRATPEQPLEFTVDETVDWDVFIEPSSASRSGFRFVILDGSGEPLPLGNDHGSTYDWFGRSGRSIASVVLEPGMYRMEVTEGTAAIAVGASPSGEIIQAVGGAVLIGGVLGLTGIVIIVVSAVRDTRRRTENAEPPPPSPWSSGEWPAGEDPAEPGR